MKPKDYPFVDPHLAILAEEKGFDELCMSYFVDTPEHPFIAVGYCGKERVSESLHLLPTYSQLVDWLREKHDLHIVQHYRKFYLESHRKDYYGFSVWEGNKCSELNDNLYSDVHHTIPPIECYYEGLRQIIIKSFEFIR